MREAKTETVSAVGPARDSLMTSSVKEKRAAYMRAYRKRQKLETVGTVIVKKGLVERVNRMLKQRGREVRLRGANHRNKSRENGDFYLVDQNGHIARSNVNPVEYAEYLERLRGPDYDPADFGDRTPGKKESAW